MDSTAFDRIWDEVFAREGELLTEAAGLARAYGISSAIESIRLARSFAEAGIPFIEFCESEFRARQMRVVTRLQREGRLPPCDPGFLKILLAKASKGAW
jgi:hypothetical protein